MGRYLLSIYQPDGDSPPPAILEPVMRNLHRLDREMRDAGVWVFAAGLGPARAATVLRNHDGEVTTTDGPFVEAKEHVGGFTVIDTDDHASALHWARRLTEVIGLPVEMRPIADPD